MTIWALFSLKVCGAIELLPLKLKKAWSFWPLAVAQLAQLAIILAVTMTLRWPYPVRTGPPPPGSTTNRACTCTPLSARSGSSTACSVVVQRLAVTSAMP